MTPEEGRLAVQEARRELSRAMRALSVPHPDWRGAEDAASRGLKICADLAARCWRERAVGETKEVRQMPRGRMLPFEGATYMGSHGESYTVTEIMPDGSARVVEFDDDAGASHEAVVDASTALRMASELDLVSRGRAPQLYVVGPMTGMHGLNVRAFERARRSLADAGYAVVIPHDFVPADAGHERAMRMSLNHLISHAGGLAVLAGSETSEGASLEIEVARQIGLPARPWREWIAGGTR